MIQREYSETDGSALHRIELVLDETLYVANSLIESAGNLIYVDRSIEEFELELKKGLSNANLVYHSEILDKFHMVNIMFLLRHLEWINALKSSILSKNAIPFASSLRGTLESAGDGYHSLKQAPILIAENANLFYKSSRGELKDIMYTMSDLEEILLHFINASKGATQYPPLSAKRYIEGLFPDQDYYKMYGELCELTHPAAPSSRLFVIQCGDKFILSRSISGEYIKEFCIRNEHKIIDIITVPVNNVIISLKILSRLKIDKYYNKEIDEVFNIKNNADLIMLLEKVDKKLKE